MKIVYYVNKLLLFITVVLGAYVYTTYFGFLGFGNAEVEKFLAIPIFIVPILVFTFIINKALKRRLHLKNTEVWFSIYAVLAFMIPLFFIDSRLTNVNGVDVQSLIMILGNIVGVLFIVWFIVMSFKSFRYGV
ncbi:MAG: hypothetical protein ACRC41_05405 [Sarcina sp.]